MFTSSCSASNDSDVFEVSCQNTSPRVARMPLLVVLVLYSITGELSTTVPFGAIVVEFKIRRVNECYFRWLQEKDRFYAFCSFCTEAYGI
jgi:hypothetical protein